MNNDFDADESDGRSYISAVSEVITDANNTCDGGAKNNMGEARMDIVSSEMGYLGYHYSESYGMTWKVSHYVKGSAVHCRCVVCCWQNYAQITAVLVVFFPCFRLLLFCQGMAMSAVRREWP